MSLPTAPSVHRNKEAILEILKDAFQGRSNILEISSGTGEHGVFFAEEMKELSWTTSDVQSCYEGISGWIKDSGLDNLKGPIDFEIGKDEFPIADKPFDGVFLANSLHIMSWKKVKTLFKLLGKSLPASTVVLFYGPFNKMGKFTSESNEQFDAWLKEREATQGIRNLEDVATNMAKNGFFLEEEIKMPANNFILKFKN